MRTLSGFMGWLGLVLIGAAIGPEWYFVGAAGLVTLGLLIGWIAGRPHF